MKGAMLIHGAMMFAILVKPQWAGGRMFVNAFNGARLMR